MSKKICKEAKNLKDENAIQVYLEMALPAKYICSKCGRFSKDEKWLCRSQNV